MGYGLGPASASAFNVPANKRAISIMGDGGFWHNGLASSIGNAVFNKQDTVIVIVDNFYSAATGGQDIPSSRAENSRRKTKNSIVEAVKGVGATWVRQIDRTYDVARLRDTFREALTSKVGPEIVVASSECMLNKQRRVRPQFASLVAAGGRAVKERFGVDEDVCTGDHACIRLSGCPSLSLKAHRLDPLKDDPVASIDNSCVGSRKLRRGFRGRRVVSLVLSGRRHLQPDTVGPLHGRPARYIDRMAAAPSRGAPHRIL